MVCALTLNAKRSSARSLVPTLRIEGVSCLRGDRVGDGEGAGGPGGGVAETLDQGEVEPHGEGDRVSGHGEREDGVGAVDCAGGNAGEGVEAHAGRPGAAEV